MGYGMDDEYMQMEGMPMGGLPSMDVHATSCGRCGHEAATLWEAWLAFGRMRPRGAKLSCKSTELEEGYQGSNAALLWLWLWQSVFLRVAAQCRTGFWGLSNAVAWQCAGERGRSQSSAFSSGQPQAGQDSCPSAFGRREWCPEFRTEQVMALTMP